MDFDQAKQCLLALLQHQGQAKNSELIAAIGGDAALFERVWEDLLFNDLAEDKKGVGLVYTGPVAGPPPESPPAVPAPEEPLPSATPHAIFLSYGRADAGELAARLHADLQHQGHRVWLDQREIRTGADWEAAIERAILASEVFVALLSPHAVRRPDGVCLDEISFARYNQRPIIPAMVVQCRPPLGIYRLDWVDFQDWRTPAGYARALAKLQAALAGGGGVEGRYVNLFAVLKPLDFSAEVARLTQDFVGREWVWAELDAWLRQGDSRVFFLTGDPGAGKSAVLAHLVHRHPQVGAYHFCVSSLQDSLNPYTFVRSLTAQLATQLDAYRGALEAVDLRQSAEDPGDQLRRWVADPLAAEALDHPLLILVDALDEAWAYGRRNIARILNERLADFPWPVRLVLSSRKVPEILDLFSRFRPYELDAGRAENRADVAAYLEQKLREPKLAQVLADAGADPQTTAQAIASKGRGNFLYVTEAVAALAGRQLDPRYPERFPEGLVEWYQRFFERLFPTPTDYAPVRPLLDVLCAAREPLTARQLAGFLEQEAFTVEQDLEKLASFFPERDGVYPAFHKSIADWLGGEAGRSRAFRVNVAAGHRRLAAHLLNLWQAGDRERFTLAHLPAHLAAADHPQALQDLLADYRFLEAKLSALGPQPLIEDYTLAAGHTAGEAVESLRLIGDALRLATHVLATDPEQLPSQLVGRLLTQQQPQVQALLASVRPSEGRPWLRPLTVSLTPSGGPLVRTLTGHTGGVMAVAVTADGRTAVVGSDDGTLRVWDLARGDTRATLAGWPCEVTAVAVTADGRTAVVGSDDGTLRVWDLARGVARATLAGHAGTVRAVAVTVDGRTAVAACNDTLMVWDLECGAECTTLLPKRTTLLPGRTGEITAVAVTADERTAVWGSRDGTLQIWDLARGIARATLAGHTGEVTAVAVTADGRTAVSGSEDRTLKVWDLAQGAERATLTGHTGRQVTAVAVTTDGRTAVSESWNGTLKVWNLNRGTERATLAGHTGEVTTMAVTADGRTAVSGSVDRTLKVWDLERGTERATLAGHTGEVTAVAVTADGRTAVSGSEDRTLKVWNLDRGAEHATLTGHTGRVTTVAVTADGRTAVSGSWDGTLRVWDLARGVARATLTSHYSYSVVTAVAVMADERTAVAAFSGTLMVLDLESGAECTTLLGGGTGEVTAVAVAADGRTAVMRSEDSILSVWNLGWLFGAHTVPADPIIYDYPKRISSTGRQPNWLRVLAVTADGRTAVLGSGGDTLKVWDLEYRGERATLVGHTGEVTTVAVAAGGRTAVSGSADHTLKVWDLEDGTLIANFSVENAITRCVVGPDGVTVVAGEASGRVHFLRLENITPGPPVLTAWHSPEQGDAAFGCTHCRTWSEIPAAALGTELPCPHCGKPVKLNPFTVEADWRPVAAAWSERGRVQSPSQ